MMRLNFFILAIILCLTPVKIFASSIVELEIDSAMRGFSGDIGASTKYNFSAGAVIEQSVFPQAVNKKIGFFLWGIDFHYFEMKNENSKMKFYQAGLIASYYFSNIYHQKVRRPWQYPHPVLRFHSGYSRAELETGSDNISIKGGDNPFIGFGGGFNIPIYMGLNLKTIYFFDTHFFKDGVVLIHSLNISLAYQVPVKK